MPSRAATRCNSIIASRADEEEEEAIAELSAELHVARIRPPNVTVALALNWEDDPTPVLIPAVKVLLAAHQ